MLVRRNKNAVTTYCCRGIGAKIVIAYLLTASFPYGKTHVENVHAMLRYVYCFLLFFYFV